MAALPADTGVDGHAGVRHGGGPLPSARRRGIAATRARHGPRHAATAASVRALRGVHVRRFRVHRARPRDCDDGRQRARGAGARAVHFPADADHRRRRSTAREPPGLGTASVGILPRPIRRRRAAGVRHWQRTGRCRLQRDGAPADRRRWVPRGREDVPLGRGAAIRRGAWQGMGRRRPGGVGRRRRDGRVRRAKGGWHLCREGASHLGSGGPGRRGRKSCFHGNFRRSTRGQSVSDARAASGSRLHPIRLLRLRPRPRLLADPRNRPHQRARARPHPRKRLQRPPHRRNRPRHRAPTRRRRGATSRWRTSSAT